MLYCVLYYIVSDGLKSGSKSRARFFIDCTRSSVRSPCMKSSPPRKPRSGQSADEYDTVDKFMSHVSMAIKLKRIILILVW